MKKLLFALILLLCSPAYAEQYHRDAFRHWIDADHDGENTRQEVIKADIHQGPGLVCPYTGQFISNPHDADIDHIIPLEWAWNHGAEQWTSKQREAFANDLENLVAVRASANRSKGSKGPDEWIPPNLFVAYWYVETWIYLCEKYHLSCDIEMLEATAKKYLPVQNGVKP